MSLTTVAPIFPGFAPSQLPIKVGTPVRSPTWNIKKTPKWSNSRQQSTNGLVTVTKYWPNPLWSWEWNYAYIKDSGLDYFNNYYAAPIPYTDMQVLQGFYAAMQGSGNQFLYQPPDSQVGGTLSVTAVSGLNKVFLLFCNNSAGACYPGLMANIAVGTATFLNGNSMIVGASPTWIAVYNNHADYPQASDSGNFFAGVVLTADALFAAEVGHVVGGYPTIPLTGTPPTTTQVNEAVQVINSSSLTVKANGGSVSPTLKAANTVSGYSGLVLQFGSAPATPVTASFPYYYLCRFSEDTQDYENFQAMLWTCSSFKFEQVRI